MTTTTALGEEVKGILLVQVTTRTGRTRYAVMVDGILGEAHKTRRQAELDATVALYERMGGRK